MLLVHWQSQAKSSVGEATFNWDVQRAACVQQGQKSAPRGSQSQLALSFHLALAILSAV